MARSRPLPVEKIAEAATPGVGATTPFNRRDEVAADDVPALEVAPKRRAAAARSTALSERAAGTDVVRGVANTHVQYASCHARTSTSAATTAVPIQLRSDAGGFRVAMRR